MDDDISLENIDDFEEVIRVLKQMLTIVSSKESIESIKGEYCEDCNEPCGRSNAEIYNCMMNRISKSKTSKDQLLEERILKRIFGKRP